MGKFTKISQSAFEGLQLETGVLLTTFNPANPVVPPDNTIICATTGGINISCVPTYSDFGADVDNAPKNTKELAHLDGWDCSVSTTSLSVNPAFIKFGLGSADIVSGGKVIPRIDLRQTDFIEVWWVGDVANGGAAAVKIFNALSTGGISLKTGKNAKGQTTITIKAFASLAAQDVVPMEFYYIEPTEYAVEFDSTGGTLIPTQVVEKNGKATEPVDPTKSGYTFGGWYKEAQFINEWDFTTDTVTANIILYAKWTAEYTVTYNSNGGTAVTSETVLAGGKATEPTPPTKQGFTFGGWYKNDTLTTAWDFSTDTVNQNTILYAKWTED